QNDDLALTPEQYGWLERQVVRMDSQRTERRKVARQVRRDDLEDSFGSDQILETMLSEVEQAGPFREQIAYQIAGRLGEEHLAAVTGRHQASRPVECRAVIVAVALLG